MKMLRTIIVRITLLLVFFSYGINAFSSKQVPSFAIEFPSEANCELCFSGYESDSFSDDQIYYLHDLHSIEVNRFLTPSAFSFFVLKKSSFSIWQPPEEFHFNFLNHSICSLFYRENTVDC